MMDPKYLHQDELIGLHAKVISAKNQDLLDIEGKIIDETKNTLILQDSNNNKKVILKKGTMVQITAPEGVFNLDCSQITKRPYDRIKK